MKLIVTILTFLLLASSVNAIIFTPKSDLDQLSKYSIVNVTNMTVNQFIKVNNSLVCTVANGLCSGNISVNSTSYFNGTGLNLSTTTFSLRRDYLDSLYYLATNPSGFISTYLEGDPLFNSSAAKNVTMLNLTHAETAYSWGNHASQGYLLKNTQINVSIINATYLNVSGSIINLSGCFIAKSGLAIC